MPSPSAVAKQWDFSLPILALAANRRGDVIACSLGDGSARFLPAYEYENTGAPKAVKIHDGISLSLQADADAHTFLSSGDDGRVFIIDPGLVAPTLLVEHKGKWVDHVASSAEGGFRAYTVGKQVHMLDAEGHEKLGPASLPSSAGGIAFSPNSKRLAASHYNGISLFWTNAEKSAPVKLVWKGSHLALIWCQDGKTIISALQENALHGWRLADNKEMQMQGYASKIHSMDLTTKGKYLATSGADQVICWPFFGGGPWGKTPLTLGGSEGSLVTRVAAHPKDEMLAAGYDNGMILLAPLDGRMEMLIHPPVATKGAAVTGLVWNGEGDSLFAGLENGYLLLFTIDSVKKSVRP
jgi:WD40 repeat protein